MTVAALAADARQRAGAAAARAGLRIAGLHEMSDHLAAGELLRRIWRADSADQVASPTLLRALEHSGNYVVGAYRGAELVGAAAAFRGDGHLHSYVAGVAAGEEGAGAGYALKQDQRAWALERGIDTVCWTFDPLVARSAAFNLRKLGASVTAYLPEWYGPMTDGVNAGDASDRLYVRWELGSARAVAAARGAPEGPRVGGAAVLLDRVGEEPAAGPGPVDAAALLVAAPVDIAALRQRDRAAALRWRYAVREALAGALAAGHRVVNLTRDGYYLLERSDDLPERSDGLPERSCG